MKRNITENMYRLFFNKDIELLKLVRIEASLSW